MEYDYTYSDQSAVISEQYAGFREQGNPSVTASAVTPPLSAKGSLLTQRADHPQDGGRVPPPAASS